MTLPLISNPVYVRTLLIKASKRTVRIHWEYAKHELLKSARVQICIRGLQDQTNTAQRHIMHRDCVDSVSARTKTESFAKESNTVPQTASKKHSADSASYREKPPFTFTIIFKVQQIFRKGTKELWACQIPLQTWLHLPMRQHQVSVPCIILTELGNGPRQRGKARC